MRCGSPSGCISAPAFGHQADSDHGRQARVSRTPRSRHDGEIRRDRRGDACSGRIDRTASASRLLWDPARREAEPLSHPRMVLRRPGKVLVLTGLAAETQAPMIMGDKTELAPTVRATVL